jgi:UDP-glucose:(heptosyl)LPS alpha-1,3-glucosyltransferase
MKLAIVRQKYTPFGGAERFVERALAALQANGTDVSIIARSWTGDVKGITCNPFFIGRTWRDKSFAQGVQRVIATNRFDLVQSHERIPGCHIYRAGDGVHATWLALRKQPFDILSPWHRYTLKAERAMFGHPNLRAVICNSHMVRDDIAQRFGIANEKLHVIYNGVDLDYFHPGLRAAHRKTQRAEIMGETLSAEANDAAKVVLFVGSGYARKGLPTLLRAMVPVDAELWVVGRDKSEQVMRQLSRTLGIDQRVRFFGGQTDVRPFYGAADVFALPTLYDPFPNAALEALACGLPVVTTHTCGAAEFITAANGQTLQAGDVKALSVALAHVIAHAESMQVAARESVSHLSLSAMAEKLLALYRRLS